jgi:hypothetical protein
MGYPLALEIAVAVIRARNLSIREYLEGIRVDSDRAAAYLGNVSSSLHPEGLLGALRRAMQPLSRNAKIVLNQYSWLHESAVPHCLLEADAGEKFDSGLLELQRFCLIRRARIGDGYPVYAKAFVIQPFVCRVSRETMRLTTRIVTLRALANRIIRAVQTIDWARVDEPLFTAFTLHAGAVAAHCTKYGLLDLAEWLTAHVIERPKVFPHA